MQGCKVYRHCVVAVLIERIGWDMKNVQISQELFVKLIQFHLLDIYDSSNEIKKGLEEKIDMMARHEAYTKSKTAVSESEREKARTEYLDMVGMHPDFRW